MRNLIAVRRLALATSALGLLAGGPATPAIAASCVWNGGTGDWSTAALWSCGAVPGSGDAVSIDTNPGIASTVNVTSGQSAGTVTLDSGDTIAINNAALGIYGGSIVNNGIFSLAYYASLVGQGTTTAITGSGTILLDDSTGPVSLYGAGTNQLSFGSGQTIQGSGSIGIDQGAITNGGIINANVAGRVLYLDGRAGSGGNTDGSGVGTGNAAGFLNTGTLEATNGGALYFYGGIYENAAGGTIRAVGAGSTVTFGNDTSILGGTLTATGGGVFSENGNGNQYLTDVTLSGGSTLGIVNDTVQIGNGFTNNGTVNLSYYAYLIGNSAGGNSIDGTGTITLDSSTGPARIYGGGANKLTIGSGQTIVGSGEVGVDQGAITSNGIINANVAGRVLYLDGRAGSGGNTDGSGVGTGNAAGFLNTNLLEATNGSTLYFYGGVYENAAGATIQAIGAGSTVTFGNDTSILGGTLTASGGGVFSENGNGNQYLTDVTLSGGSTFNIVNGAVRIGNGFTNNGTVNLSYYADLVGNSPTGNSIDGTGTITLDSSTGPARIYGGGANKLTIGGGQTIVGSGEVGVDSGAVTSNGIIDANVAGRVIYLDGRGGSPGNTDGSGLGTFSAGFVNTNLLEATNGGALVFYSGLYDNRDADIKAIGTGSTVTFNNDASILGGTLTATGGGVFSENGNGTQYLTDVTLADGGIFNIVNDTVRIGNGFTNNGTVNLSYYADLVGNSADGNSIDGTGAIILDDSSGPARIYGAGTNKLTIGNGQTISGSGQVGLDSGAVTNSGIIDANVAGRSITLDGRGGSTGNTDGSGLGGSGAGFVNTNLLEATNGGALLFNSGLYDNVDASIQAIGAGSTVSFNNDASILGGTLTSSGGGLFSAVGLGTQYITDVTLSAGSTFNIANDTVRIGNSFINDGTVSLANYGSLIGNSATTTITGSGSIVLDNSGGPATLYGAGANRLVIDSQQTVRGSGQIGLDSGAIYNAGNILADGAITLDARGGGGGNGDMSGYGTDSLAGFYNADGGQLQANNGGATLTLAGGLYENAAGGSFSAGTGSSFNMDSDANLANLKAGGVLDQGLYFAFAGGTMTLRSDQTGSIVTIGADRAGTDSFVSLSGAGSTIQVTPRGGGTTTTIDQSLTAIARSGELSLAAGRGFTAQGDFTNAGILALDGGASFAAGGLVNSGTVTGNGTVATPITNSGIVVADNGTLASQAITGTTGTVQSNAGATLSLANAAADSTAGFLTIYGALALGGNSITVTGDYQNAAFGSGNGFDAHANVSGSGLILAASATQDLSGPGLSGDTLNVGNVRLGNSSSTVLTITNNGTLTTLRGAVESPITNTVAISSSNFIVGPNGGSTNVTLSYTGTTAGSLNGQTITVANNFDNVVDRTLGIIGAAYNAAVASITPNPVDLGATRVGGTLSGGVTIANTAPAGAYSEKLAVTGVTGANGASGTAPGGLIDAGGSAGATVSLGTATSGIKSGTVTYALATDGTGTSGLAQAALASQSVAVNGKVYQLAEAQLGATNVSFATVRQGAVAPTASVSIANIASGALNDTLNTSIGALPATVTGSGGGALAGGQSGTLSFSENTATAGAYSGGGQINFTSTDPDLAPVALTSQNIAFSGVVTQVAIAQIVKDAGAGSFAGSGNLYTLDLGTIMAGIGSLSTDLGVFNAIPNFSYDETLGGTFSASGGTGYSFAGTTFAGLAGQGTATGNLLTFAYAGLGDGIYTDTLTFGGASHYAGLTDLALSPITVNVTARITGSASAVPEPGSWAMMLVGFGAVGLGLRRRRPALAAVKA